MDLKNNLLLVIITGLVTLLLGFGAGVLLAKSTASSNPITVVQVPQR